MTNTEFWLTPLILLPGVALLIASTSARFAQVVMSDEMAIAEVPPYETTGRCSIHAAER